jgi:hypothetical protein
MGMGRYVHIYSAFWLMQKLSPWSSVFVLPLPETVVHWHVQKGRHIFVLLSFLFKKLLRRDSLSRPKTPHMETLPLDQAARIYPGIERYVFRDLLFFPLFLYHYSSEPKQPQYLLADFAQR